MKKFVHLCLLFWLGSEAIADDVERVARLSAIAEHSTDTDKHAPTGQPNPSSGIALLAPEGQAFVGNQLDQFDRSEPGVLRTTKPAWISLYWTESRDFTLSGEVNLGGAYPQMLFPGDLPDGFALFVREWDGVQRYQIDSHRIMAKRRLLKGRVPENFENSEELPTPAIHRWIPFRASVSQRGITFQFGEGSTALEGPLDVDGANKIAIAPGTMLRDLRLSFSAQTLETPGPSRRPVLSSMPTAPTSPNGNRFELSPSSREVTIVEARTKYLPGTPASAGGIINGGFDEKMSRDSSGQFGEAMFEPGSERLPGWSVAGGPVGLRDNPRSPAGGSILELAPRHSPGTISQKVRTESGKDYTLTFLACAGRNDQIKVRVANLERSIHCPRQFERVSIPFKAESAETLISLSGVGDGGFGPMIDDVQLQ